MARDCQETFTYVIEHCSTCGGSSKISLLPSWDLMIFLNWPNIEDSFFGGGITVGLCIATI